MLRGVVGILAAVALLVPSTAGAETNLIANGSFEGSVSGWGSSNGSLSLASDGIVGSGALRSSLVPGATWSFSAYPSPRPVASTVAGTTYTARAWFRSDTPARPLCLRIREYSAGGSLVAAVDGCSTSSYAWQRFAPLSYTTTQSGGTLTAYVFQREAVSGDSFEIDGVELYAGSPPPPPPADTTPPPAPTLTSTPPSSTTSTSASFGFTDAEAGVTYTCALDGAAATACVSPKAYSGLAVAQHSFAVRAYDAAGNGSVATSYAWSVTAPPPSTTGDPVIAAAGDIACAPSDAGYNGGAGTGSRCMQGATGNQFGGIANLAAVLPLGDEQYTCGEAANFSAVYAVTWGSVKAITRPVPGNHEYGATAACTASNAEGYYGYFGAGAGDPTRGYYSYDVGAWHLIALNSNCAAVGGCGAGSAQETWLRSDLASHTNLCTLAYWHHPRFSAGQAGDDTRTATLWNDLVAAHADIVLAGHDHTYQRFGRMNTSGALDSTGVRQVVVGTGGEDHQTAPLYRSSLSRSDNTTFGVLKLTLHPGGYDGQFLPAAGTGSFSDSFSTACT